MYHSHEENCQQWQPPSMPNQDSLQNVDWGSLAKQWVASQDVAINKRQHHHQPPPPPPPPPGYTPEYTQQTPVPRAEQPPWENSYWNQWAQSQLQWGMPNTFDYGHGQVEPLSSADEHFVPTHQPPIPETSEGNTLDHASEFLDASKRKRLPAWIREGLEKMERDKRRKIEEETKPRTSLEGDVESDAELSDASPNRQEETASTNSATANEGKDDCSDVEEKEEKMVQSSPENESHEEKQLKMMMKVKKMLTEVLLEVTDFEIQELCQEVLVKAKKKQQKTPARQLAQSTALASISNFGLAAYFSASEESSEESETQVHEPSSDEEELKIRVAFKQREFQQKMQFLEEEEQEEKNDAVSDLSDNIKASEDTYAKPKSNRNDITDNDESNNSVASEFSETVAKANDLSPTDTSIKSCSRSKKRKDRKRSRSRSWSSVRRAHHSKSCDLSPYQNNERLQSRESSHGRRSRSQDRRSLNTSKNNYDDLDRTSRNPDRHRGYKKSKNRDKSRSSRSRDRRRASRERQYSHSKDNRDRSQEKSLSSGRKRSSRKDKYRSSRRRVRLSSSENEDNHHHHHHHHKSGRTNGETI